MMIQLLIALSFTSGPCTSAELAPADPHRRVLTQDEKTGGFITTPVPANLRKSSIVDIVDKESYPSARFIITIAPDGVGHLQARYDYAFPRHETFKDHDLLSWNDRISFFDGHDWIKLTSQNAAKLFGQPSENKQGKQVFYTYSVKCDSDNQDARIYQMDLKFDHRNVIQAYRITGTGVTNPKWVAD